MRGLFNYLMHREELEYHLPSDADDPDIPGGCYRAPRHSRWNTPEFACIAADTIRKIRILQTTKAMFNQNAGKWMADIRSIAQASSDQFLKLQSILGNQRQHSIADLAQQARHHNILPLYNALRYVTFQTANIPLTQGYKTSIRQLGFALNLYDGPLTIFLTTNFADTYSAITATLINAAGKPLGTRKINLLKNVPDMPTLQAVHRELAKHPMLQADLFLFLDGLVHTDLLCINAWCGKKKYGMQRRPQHKIEDDFASTAQLGIAHFPRSALKPLESQGRGFTHGHEKVISVPQTKAARLEELFAASATEQGEYELTKWCEQAREALLQAAESLQYDSATLSGKQLGVELLPEPFTIRQQQQSKFDGLPEIDGSGPRLPTIEVTGKERNGHEKMEEALATAEQRPLRHPYKEMPLTGVHQSMLPQYRLSSSFGRIQIPDEFGNYFGLPTEPTATDDAPCELFTCHKEFVQDDKGEITVFSMPDGAQATQQQLDADSQAWSTSFARDQRAGHVHNQNHDCTGTCVKYAKKIRKQHCPSPSALVQKSKGTRHHHAGLGSSERYCLRLMTPGAQFYDVVRVSYRAPTLLQATTRMSLARLWYPEMAPSGRRRKTYCNRQCDATPTISTRKERCPQMPTCARQAVLLQSETSLRHSVLLQRHPPLVQTKVRRHPQRNPK